MQSCGNKGLKRAWIKLAPSVLAGRHRRGQLSLPAEEGRRPEDYNEATRVSSEAPGCYTFGRGNLYRRAFNRVHREEVQGAYLFDTLEEARGVVEK